MPTGGDAKVCAYSVDLSVKTKARIATFILLCCDKLIFPPCFVPGACGANRCSGRTGCPESAIPPCNPCPLAPAQVSCVVSSQVDANALSAVFSSDILEQASPPDSRATPSSHGTKHPSDPLIYCVDCLQHCRQHPVTSPSTAHQFCTG